MSDWPTFDAAGELAKCIIPPAGLHADSEPPQPSRESNSSNVSEFCADSPAFCMSRIFAGHVGFKSKQERAKELRRLHLQHIEEGGQP